MKETQYGQRRNRVAAGVLVATVATSGAQAGAFLFSGGPNQAASATDTLRPGVNSPWQYTAGTSTIYALATASDGTIVSPSEQDLGQGVLTQYSPFRLMLVRGTQPGAQQTTSLQVNVSNISDPGPLMHAGSLALTITYLGRYQVTVPAGTHSADLIKWQYNGQVGPARVSDVEHRFFARALGWHWAGCRHRQAKCVGHARLEQRSEFGKL